MFRISLRPERPTPVRRRVALLGLVVGLTLSWPVATRAQDPGGGGPGNACCLELLVPVGARATAMGGANVALQGTDAAFLNPAGLAGLPGTTIVVHHSDIGGSIEQVEAFSLVTTQLGITVGLSYQLLDKGEITTTDDMQQPTGQLAFRDHLGVLSVATGLFPGLYAGLSYKYYQQRVDCTGTLCGSIESVASTSAVDAGVRFVPVWIPALELGVSVVYAGPALRGGNGDEEQGLPGRLNYGVSYDVLAGPTDGLLALRLILAARDALDEPGSPTLAIGTELEVQEAVFLRAGWAPGEGLGTGASLGLELRYDRFHVAVARSFVNSQLESDSQPFQISFALTF